MSPFGGSGRYLGQYPPRFSRLADDRDLSWVVPVRVRYVVGVTGLRMSGKSTVLNYLSEKKAFRVYSLATIVREVADRRGVPHEPRSHLQDLGDELRAGAEDPALLGRLVLQRIRADHLDRRPQEPLERVAIGGFKRPEELELLRRLGTFHVVRVEAQDARRLERAKASGVLGRELLAAGKPAEPQDIDAFRAEIDLRDRDGRRQTAAGDLFGQYVDGVNSESADSVLPNDGQTPQMLLSAVDELIDWLDRAHRSSAL